MIRYFFTVVFCLVVMVSFGQSVGDYRTRTVGNWNQLVRWQVFYNGGWRNIGNINSGPYYNVTPSHLSGVITINHNITVTTSITVNQLVISNGVKLTINAGQVVTVVDDFTQTPILVNSTAVLSNLGSLDLQSQLSTSPCQINGILSSSGAVQISNASLLVFNSGSTYSHGNNTGGNIPLASWNLNSTCLINGLSAVNPTAPGNLGQSFGNFTWNTPSMGATTTFSLGGGLQTVNGDLTIVSTGTTSREVRLKNGGPGYNLSVGGNFVIQGGTVTLTQNQTTSTSVSIGGNLVMSGGTLTLGNLNNAAIDVFLNGNFQKTGGVVNRGTGAGAGTIHFDGATQTYTNNSGITSAVNFAVENGSVLNLGTAALTGTGTLNLNTGGTIYVGSVDVAGAIQTGTTAGNIRVSGVRTYQAGSTIVYNGAAQQFMALGHPAAVNTTIANTNDVRMLADATINGNITVSSGNFLIESNTLTLGGLYNQVGGFIGISPNSSIVINGSGTFGNLILLPYSFPGNPMNNLTINRAGGGPNIISQGTANLSIAGTFTLQEGDMFLGSNNSLTVLGNFVRVNGTLSSDVFGNFAISGTGSLPSDIVLTGAINNLSMDRTNPNPGGNVFNTSSTLVVNNLNLTSGNFAHTGGVSMADGGTITRRWGVLNNAVGAVGQYNVVYGANNAPNINSGFELPASAGILDNLTLDNTFNVTDPFAGAPFTLTLTSPVLAGGNVTVTEGTLITNDFDIDVGGNFLVDTNGLLQAGSSTLTFNGGAAQTISSVSTLDISELIVNQSASTSVSLLSPMNISTRLAVNSSSIFSAGTNILTLVSTPTATANVAPLVSGASITGSVIVQRYLPKANAVRNYFYMTSPVTNSGVPDWDVELPIGRVYRWNEPTTAYVPYGLSGTLPSGRGFAVDVSSASTFTYDVRGILGQGNISVPVTAKTSQVDGPDGWNLIGNPYPSAIDWDNIALPAGVYDAIYFTDNFNNSGQGTGVQSVTYVDGVGTPASFSGQIAQGQAFWVKAIGNTSLTFTEAAKISSTNTQFYREGEVPNVLRIAIEGQGIKDEAVIRLREGATDNFDGRYDAHQFLNATSSLTTLTADNISAVINAIGMEDCNRTIPLVAKGFSSGSYQFSFVGMGSFEAQVNIVLIDRLMETEVNLRGEQEYSFTVSDQDLNLIGSRFVVSISAPKVKTDVVASGDQICENSGAGVITISDSETGVQYSAEWEGLKISETVTGTGGSIQIPVTASSLKNGENLVSIVAQASCSRETLVTKPVIKVVKKGEIGAVIDGTICNNGTTTLVANGASEGGWYHWYYEEDDAEPIIGQKGQEFVTPVLLKSATYFVSAVNALGCEGARVAVKANVTIMEDAAIHEDGATLVSNYESGNEWYFNGELIIGEKGNTLEMIESGTYTLKVTKDGCSSTASREMAITALEENLSGGGFVEIFPNPTQNNVTVTIKSVSHSVKAVIFNSSGVEIESKQLIGDGEMKGGEFNLQSYTSGIYNLRISDGAKIIIKKIAKIN